jgi:hypothetical protein
LVAKADQLDQVSINYFIHFRHQNWSNQLVIILSNLFVYQVIGKEKVPFG